MLPVRFIPSPHVITNASHVALPILQSTVHVPEPHVIPSPLHAFVPLQSTVQVPLLTTFKFSQALSALQSTVHVPELVTCTFSQALTKGVSKPLQRTTIVAVAATAMVHPFDPSPSFISMRQFAFAAHVAALSAEVGVTTFAQQLVMLAGGVGQVANANTPLSCIHVAAEE